MTRALRNPASLVVLFAVAYAIFATLLIRTHAYARNPDVVAWGITFDLVITVPAAWWLLVVRRGHARPATLIPLFALCSLAAARIIPAQQHAFIDQLRWVAAPLDVVTVALVARRLARGASAGDSLVLRVTAAEVKTIYYALFAWRKKTPPGFTFHARSGWGAVLAALLLVLGAESIGLHLFIAQYSVRAAWIVTALDVYGILWLLGDYNALRLRTTTIDAEAVHVRFGMRWSATIARANVAAVVVPRGDSEWRRRDVMKLAVLDEPLFVVRLHEPVVATGIAGIQRRVTALAVRPDEPEAFLAALTGVTPAASPAATS